MLRRSTRECARHEAVIDLCARLDNLPLALELAAARTVVFSPEQLLDRLSERLDLLKAGRDADPRQQTLRATIEWSYDLLDERERGLFRCFSVFAGGCRYEAAEAVCDANPDSLQSLLDKSLLRRVEGPFGPRYLMLETIRELATEKLGAEEETDASSARPRRALPRPRAVGEPRRRGGGAATLRARHPRARQRAGGARLGARDGRARARPRARRRARELLGRPTARTRARTGRQPFLPEIRTCPRGWSRGR